MINYYWCYVIKTTILHHMQKEIKKDSTCLFLFERLYKKMKAYASIFSLYSKNSSYDDKRSKHPFAFNSITRVAIVCTN